MDIDGRKEKVYGYVIQDLAYQLNLGKPWMEKNDDVYLAKKRKIRFGSKVDSMVVKEKGWYKNKNSKTKTSVHYFATAVKAVSSNFISLIKLAKRQPGSRILAISMEDINKALEAKTIDTPELIKAQLPHQIKFFYIFAINTKD